MKGEIFIVFCDIFSRLYIIFVECYLYPGQFNIYLTCTFKMSALNLVIYKNYTVKCFLFGTHPGISLAVSRLKVQNVFVTGKKNHTTVGVVHGFVRG